jgi:SAM-dependent methyltransferase
MKEASARFRLLGDEMRLRILRLLGAERLNVTELTGVLGIAQSGVSRHLGLLREAGLVEERREGGFTWYRLPPEESRHGAAALWGLLAAEFDASAADPIARADRARLQEVLRLRKESFATHGEGPKQLVPGRSWAAWARALGHLLPPMVVADLGCGEGYLTIEAARWASRVYAVDRSTAVMARGRELARRRQVSNIVWKQGELDRVPLESASVDVVLLSQALHHAVTPAAALQEAVRILRPQGRLLVLDLRRHDQEWVRDRFGDQWLGFEDTELAGLLTDAGLSDVRVGVGARLRGDPFTVLVASGTRDADLTDTMTARATKARKSTKNTQIMKTRTASDATATDGGVISPSEGRR